ncbi:uncharacterized protein LOC133791901 [Humulus lupulus]|uniref:uncharacterized protein LOC133791901 n=1 Tax=Humulus lupulus TaxID=3486 RepID=UPI002B403372|nr:uncharacterized protein LOC133791901 [Humulus lupulus]
MVLGANPPFAVFEGFIKRMWGKLGIERIARLNAGYTLVKFRDEVTRDLVLEAGVIHFDRKPIIVRPWTIDLADMRLVKSVPIWVRLPGLGLQYWGTKCLSALMITIGKPILVDKVTKDRSMMQFARVLVEIEISDEIPKSIKFLNERGQLMEQFVEFEWLPTQCKHCRVYGHTEALCNRKKGEVWRPKERKPEGENKENSSEPTNVAITTGLAAEVISKDKQKEVTKERTDCPLKTSSSDADIGQVSKNFQVDVGKERCDTNESQEADWITPKRMGGVKNLATNALNKLRNTYSVLQDKKMEVANLAFTIEKSLNKIGIGAFLETKLRGNKLEEMIVRQFDGWKFYKGTANEGRILMVWQISVLSVEIVQDSDQFIHAYVKELSSGDFNSVFEFDDRLGGRAVSAAEMADAQRWKSMGLVDELRSIAISTVNSGFKPFQFFNMWTEYEGFKDAVMQSWNKSINAHGSEGIMRKLRRLTHVLRQFNKREIGDVEHKFNLAKETYNSTQYQLQHDPHSAEFQTEERASFENLVQQARYYDSYLRQRSKVNWLRFGDDNTAYFHACLKQRKASNRIASFINDAGQINEKFEDVMAHFLNHFWSIMGNQSKAFVPIQKEYFIHGGILSLDQQLELINPFTKKDVKNAMFSISSIKSLGPDGYGSGFFKVMWDAIGDEISDAILGFFNHGSLPNALNNATLSL